ncbi:hybrid sensor histidine kinase/response regulator [Solirubrobacter soli]|uniref:hybrid sensor histidine kinase/response regulator n=1 Tax=Solirubrobacter soli TaxID=363832 RepID=UPI00146D23DB|nr:PAS domain S-box protein [Solirubrobacter soli]
MEALVVALLLTALVFRAARLLARARRRELAIIESTVDAVVMLDAEGRIQAFNASAERIFGRRREDVLGRELGPLVVPEEHREAHRQGVRRAVATGESKIIGRPVELTALRADGTEFPAEITISRLSGEGPLTFVGHVRDVTERRAGETAARALAALVEYSADAIVLIGPDRRVESWNAGAEQIYGYRRDEAIGRSVAELIMPPERRDELPTAIERLVDAGSLTFEVMHMRRDGSEFPVAATASVIAGAQGELVGISLITRDMTERAELEEQLRQSQKMDAIGQLAGGIAHDFNNLLTVIAGYGQLARARVGGGPGSAELAEIGLAAERAAILTRQLLAFSRRQILDPIVLDLGEVVRALTPMLERLIGEDIVIQVRSQDRLPGVLADQGQIEQVVVNLAVNARDAMPDGGRLEIETRADGVFVRLAVTDTGVGIPAEDLPHVFEPFYTTKPVGQGTGLGLASVHGAITQSGGNVRVRSQEGVGTTVEISLPATSERGRAAPASGSAETLGGHETILLCEDEEGVRALVEIVLSGAGYRVLGEARPNDAIERAAREDIDALVTDVIMPDMPGPELARRLELPTLFVSGYTADTVHGRGSLPPGSAFLEKPFDSDTLLRTVRELLDAR